MTMAASGSVPDGCQVSGESEHYKLDVLHNRRALEDAQVSCDVSNESCFEVVRSSGTVNCSQSEQEFTMSEAVETVPRLRRWLTQMCVRPAHRLDEVRSLRNLRTKNPVTIGKAARREQAQDNGKRTKQVDSKPRLLRFVLFSVHGGRLETLASAFRGRCRCIID